jgi:hypothetical protein
VRNLIEGSESFRQPDIAKQALAVATKDKRRYRVFIDDIVYGAAYEITRQVVSEARVRRGLHVVGDAAFTPEAAERDFSQRHVRFWNWIEHHGDKSSLLPKMRHEELALAIQEREDRGQNELVIARWLRKIDRGLEGDQTVEERYTEEELAELYRQAEEEAESPLSCLR